MLLKWAYHIKRWSRVYYISMLQEDYCKKTDNKIDPDERSTVADQERWAK